MGRTRIAAAVLMVAGVAALSACGTTRTHHASAEPTTSPAAVSLASMRIADGTAKANNAPPDTGDYYTGPAGNMAARQWVQLSAGAAGGVKPVVLNGAGFTLYRFDKDTPSPSVSNCTGACVTTWPPVLVRPGSKIYLDGVSKSDVGVIRRDGGTFQVTIGHWPVYRFSKDTAPGQTNGENVGGTWFAVSPHGTKVLPVPGTGTPPSTGPVTLGNGSVLLDSGKNFTEPNGSEGLAGPGCRNVSQPNLASSLSLSGGPIKIWTGPNCTGTSAVVKGDVADLATIGFDKKIVSIRFGS